MPRRPGGTVLDIGCGTGLNFRALRGVVGETGRVVGVDPSPAMLAKARDRTARENWSNVDLVEGSVGDVELPDGASGALICLVHDVMRSPESLKHVVAHVAPGETVVAAGAKLVPPTTWWAPGLNYLVLEVNRPYITSAEGLDRPWSHLATLLPDLRVEVDPWGVTYSAVGTVPGEPQ
jgi:SAM-dependent methyltransferase